MSFLSSATSMSILVFACLVVLPNLTVAFSTIRNTAQRRLVSHQYLTPKHSPLNDEPWEKDESYWDMLQAASKDPETFEKFIDESMSRSKRTSSSIGQEGKHSSMPSSSGISNGANGNDDDTKREKKYVPIEEWEEKRKNGENMSWEERLQWESQRSGDQFRQNEILRQNLKQF